MWICCTASTFMSNYFQIATFLIYNIYFLLFRSVTVPKSSVRQRFSPNINPKMLQQYRLGLAISKNLLQPISFTDFIVFQQYYIKMHQHFWQYFDLISNHFSWLSSSDTLLLYFIWSLSLLKWMKMDYQETKIISFSTLWSQLTWVLASSLFYSLFYFQLSWIQVCF